MARKRRGGRAATGTLVKTRDGRWQALIPLVDGTRKRWPPGGFPAGTSEANAREKALYWTQEARRLGLRRKSPQHALDDAAADADEMARWLDAWFRHRAQTLSSRDKAPGHWRKYVAPAMGTKHIRDWTAADLRELVARLDDQARAGAIQPKTALNIWASVTAACRAACQSKRGELVVRDDNPAANVEGPDRGVRKAKQLLFPAELDALLRCPALPLAYRRLVALSAYLYCRPGELAVLRWRDVDLERGNVRIHRAYDHKTGASKPTKTGRTRDLRVEAPALGLLRTMADETDDELVVRGLVDLNHLTEPLRRALLAAGVDRPALHEAEETSKAFTWYDLRATGITYRCVRGDDPVRIMYDAGHTNLATTQGYIRAAEAFAADTFGDVFAALPSELVGAANYANPGSKRTRQSHASAQATEMLCEGGDSNPHSQSGH